MIQFLLMAYDGQDEGALTRRMTVRALHFEGARQLKEDGHFNLGGAIMKAR